MTGLSVTAAVYQHEGKPSVDKPVTFDSDALCGTCRERAQTAPAHLILTSQFGSWDAIIVDPKTGARWLCAACAWAWRAVKYRQKATIVRLSEDGDVSVEHPPLTGLLDALDGPIPLNVAISVPLSKKKAVLPTARWGQVAFDTMRTTWTPRMLRQLRAARHLRARGVAEPDLLADSPPGYLLAKVDTPEEHDLVVRLWRALDPVRHDKTFMPLLLTLSRKDKTLS